MTPPLPARPAVAYARYRRAARARPLDRSARCAARAAMPQAHDPSIRRRADAPPHTDPAHDVVWAGIPML